MCASRKQPPLYIGASGPVNTSLSTTLTYNAASLAGDLLILVAQCDDADAISTPSGWTLLTTQTNGAKLYVWWKIKAADTSVFVPDPGSNMWCEVYTFRRVSATFPIGSAATGTPAQSSAISVAGPTTTDIFNMIFTVVAHEINSSGQQVSGWACANLTAITEIADYDSGLGWDGGFAVMIGLMNGVGAVGTITASMAGSSKQMYCSFPIRPA